MAYNTGNAIGSTSPKDLSDNARNLDLLVLGPLLSYPDRRGVNRLSWAGIEASFAAAQAKRTADFNSAQAQRAADYAASEASRGYENPVPYAAGIALTRVTQLIQYSSELYKAKAGTLPWTTTGVWATDAAKLVSVGDAALRYELAGDSGANLVKYKSPLAGAVSRAVGLTLDDMQNNVMRFGAVGDGAYHPLSEFYQSLESAQLHYSGVPVVSLTQSIDWAACQAALNTGRPAYAPMGKYVVTDTLNVPRGGGIIGDGADEWVSGYTYQFLGTGGTNLLFYGNGAKTFSIPHISASALMGASISNPSASEPHYAAASTPAATYSMLELTNSNAVGATPASLKQFSVAINVAEGGNVRLEHFRALPWYNGFSGYQSITNTGLGDAWDGGLLLRNAESCYLNNVQIVGYWRMFGLLKAAITTAWDSIQENESDTFMRCKFQGHTGVSVRSYDVNKVVAVTSGTISIPWYAQHCFPSAGRIYTEAGQFQYSNLTYDSGLGRLVFSVIGDASSVVVGGLLTYYGTTWGTSGTQFIDCQINDLGHASRMCSTNTHLDTPFPMMGKAIELGGEQTRAIQFSLCTVIARDDILIYQTRSRDAQFIGSYFESQAAYGSVNSGDVLPTGGRWIAQESAQGSVPTNGGTVNLRMIGTIATIVDLRPYAGTAQWARFSAAGDTGMFKPQSVFNDVYTQDSQSSGDSLVRAARNLLLQCGASGDIALTIAGGGPDLAVRGRSINLDLMGTTRVRLGTAASDGTNKVINFVASSSGLTPNTNGDKNLGSTTARFDEGFINRLRLSTASILTGAGVPEGFITAGAGSLYLNLNGGAGTSLYVKQSGSGNTGWVAK